MGQFLVDLLKKNKAVPAEFQTAGGGYGKMR